MLDEFKNAFQRHNNAHVQLIIINVVVFVVLGVIMVVSEISGFPSFFEAIHRQFQIPARFTEFVTRPWTLLTYSFAHDLSGILHILFNMLTLYWFGKLFVEYLGSDKLIAVYVLGGIAGAVFYLLSYNFIPYFVARLADHQIIMVGASASVNAIVVAAATLLPDYTFFLLFFGAVRIKYIAAIIVFLSFLGTIGGNAGGNLAHLGGALMGFIYIRQLQAGVNWGGWITSVIDATKSLFQPRPKVKVTYRKDEHKGRKTTSVVSKASQDEIDAILDKISDRGYESLSKEEKEKLFNASKK
ncbi:MAG: rhomboid family intramembrane serine protease [Cyclobacteriaceae bacterium]|jgi:membrane associated rhomboid family serine protease|nr:rhomboid family intramembrane serine protease [Flammeovirgaceae bacterium]